MSQGDTGEQAGMRRILLALDALNCEPAPIDSAAALAVLLGAELEALFVEDDDLYAAAELPITHEISATSARERELSSAGLETALRAISRAAEARFRAAVARDSLRGSFRTTRGRRSEALGAACAGVDLLLVPATRTVVRLRIAAVPVPAPAPRIHVLCGATPASVRTLELAVRLAERTHEPLQVLSVGKPEAEALAATAGAGAHPTLHEAPAGATLAELLGAIDARPGDTLLLAADLPAATDRTGLLEALAGQRCEVLLVN